jgi:tRNA(fMet)-specific endonuclease VapC
MERLRHFLAGPIDVAPFGEEDAAVAGELRAALEAKGTPIGPYDLLIAAQSLRSGATLVTANTSEFARVKGLALEN